MEVWDPSEQDLRLYVQRSISLISTSTMTVLGLRYVHRSTHHHLELQPAARSMWPFISYFLTASTQFAMEMHSFFLHMPHWQLWRKHWGQLGVQQMVNDTG